MKITRRRVLSLTGAMAALAMPVTTLAIEGPTESCRFNYCSCIAQGKSQSCTLDVGPETFTLLRAGSLTTILDANDTNVYIRAGDKELMTPGSAARLGALLAIVRDHPEADVFEFRLPGEGRD